MQEVLLDHTGICKKNNDTMVRNTLRNVPLGSLTPKTDRRGRAPAHNKIDRDLIRAHVETFHPDVSHYRREHALETRYLPSDITVDLMHKDIIGKNGVRCSYDLYRKTLKKMNISFTKYNWY